MIRTTFSIIILLIAGAVFFLYTKPSYDTLQTLSAQNAQYDAALSKATQLQTVKQSLLSRYNSFDPGSLDRLQTMLPDQVDNIRLILDLDNIASRYGMALQNVDISTPDTSNQTVVGAISTASQSYDSLTLQFTTHGTYAQFKQFLSDLQSSLRIVDLVSLSIAQEGSAVSASGQALTGAGAQPVYTYVMTLQTYWLR
jgi:Tfp pilus assembly protein PilO